jgi:hypothetical protein
MYRNEDDRRGRSYGIGDRRAKLAKKHTSKYTHTQRTRTCAHAHTHSLAHLSVTQKMKIKQIKQIKQIKIK